MVSGLSPWDSFSHIHSLHCHLLRKSLPHARCDVFRIRTSVKSKETKGHKAEPYKEKEHYKRICKKKDNNNNNEHSLSLLFLSHKRRTIGPWIDESENIGRPSGSNCVNPCLAHRSPVRSVATSNKCIASSNKKLLGAKKATRNKCIASSNKCLTSSNKKLLELKFAASDRSSDARSP